MMMTIIPRSSPLSNIKGTIELSYLSVADE